MDLIDLIGDTRTESLPPGFLRSIKIKYRQEASHVFPKESKDAVQDTDERVKTAASDKSTPATTNSNIMEVVDKWLATASDKEREIALKFFSTLAGSKAQFLKSSVQKYHTHIEGNCHYCDGDRINDTLESLAKGDKPHSRSKAIHRREPYLANHSVYQHSRLQLSSGVRRSYQTWHHLPIYNYSHGVPNKSSMFIQPHKAIGRHFSIHPEWGLHMGVKHAAF
ncbi:hypothetical protein QZH41_009539 [Actinostola sp. cb2023]|nr:hypothetical protein QZH41_009539 [Actinostola sp. cb2023]